MNNENQASRGSSDLLILMIFRCSFFISFPDVFQWYWCFERVWRGWILIPTGLLKAKSVVRIKHVQGVILDAREGPKPWNIMCWNLLYFPGEYWKFQDLLCHFWRVIEQNRWKSITRVQKVAAAQAPKILVFDGVTSPMQFHWFPLCFWSSPPKLLLSLWFYR